MIRRLFPARFTDPQLEFAKWLALLGMLVNHVALASSTHWREIGTLIGRVSLPLFSLIIVFRLQHDTEARARRYLFKLLIWAVVSQPIYLLLLSGWDLWRLNALFTLAAGVGLILAAAMSNIGIATLLAAFIVLGSGWLDGGFWMPLAQLGCWYLLKRDPQNGALAVGLAAAFAALMNLDGSDMQAGNALVALLGMPVILSAPPSFAATIPRAPTVLFYAFYPVHLAVIYLAHGAY